MIVDTSALVAIAWLESDWRRYADALDQADGAALAAPTYVEAAIVVGRGRRVERVRVMDALLRRWRIDVVPFTVDHAELAAEAYRVYGRGAGHPAQLNLGDTYSYALAAAADEPLLYKGEDFVHTDLRSALDA